MKASKKFIVWALISLTLQLSLYFYLDKFYFGAESNIKISEANDIYKAPEIKPNVAIPTSAYDISVSDDGSYTAYVQNQMVKVFDTNTGKQVTLDFTSGVQCLAYEWVPDTNRMIIAENVSGQIRFFSYNAEKKYKEEVKDYINGKANTISVGRNNVKVGMQMSVLTGVMYIKVSFVTGRARIYRLDVNEELTRVATVTDQIGKFDITSREDDLIYEDSSSGRVRSTKIRSNLIADGNTSLKLLGVDENNNVYVSYRTDKINKIFYGQVTSSGSNLKTVNLGLSCDSNNIVISSGGNIYLVDALNSNLVNLKNNTKYKYSGKFIGLFSDRIASVSNNKLVLQTID
ncbi:MULTISPECIES: hypothetical protein [Clostridium]|uniref:hypothetical protein n=1 Tax=Clostridium TaxID=1485 RepID=UPI0008242110|nr:MULTISPECIES: hypothetical protein [Clostridium]PJI09486.1 hypothetical protein CUB90_17155 [Clostridium sp. CT7]